MASNNIARLGVVLGLDSAQFQADIDKAIAANRKLKQAIKSDSNAAAGAIAELKNATDDYGKTLTKVEQIQREVTSGRYMNATQDLKDRLLQQAAAYDKVVAQQSKLNKGMTDQQKIQVSYQMTDLVTQIASGQNAMIALMQQGGQLKDVFGGIGNMFRALISMITPFKVAMFAAAAGIGTLGAAYIMGTREAEKFRDMLILTNNFSGLFGRDIVGMSDVIANKLNVSLGQAREGLTELASSGQFSKDSIGSVTDAVLLFSKLTGTDAKEAAKQLGSSFDGTASSAKRLNDRYHFLTLEQYKQIEAFERAGKKQEAIKATADAFNKMLNDQERNLGTLEKAWNALGKAINSAWEKLKGFGKTSLEQSRKDLQENISYLESQAARYAGTERGANIENRLKYLRQSLKEVDDQFAAAEAKREAQAKEDAKIANDIATGGAAGAISRAAELEKAKIETRYSLMRQYLSEELNLERNAAKEVEMARSETKYKNMQENGRLATHNAAILAEREKQIAAQLEKDKEALRRQYREQAMEEQQRELQEYRDAAANRMEIEARAAIAMRDDLDLQERALRVAREKASISTDLLFVSETERRVAESRFDLEQKIFELRRNKQLTPKVMEEGIDRLKDMQAMRESLIAFEESIARVNAKWDSVFNNMASALENFVRTGKLSFKDLARSIIADLIAIEMRAQGKVLFSLMKKAITGFGGGGDLETELYGSYRASGGTVSAGSPYMVGERGPELFVPSQSGTIVPNNNLAAMGGGSQVINNYNISAIDVKSFEERILGSSRAVWAANAYAGKSLAVAQGRA